MVPLLWRSIRIEVREIVKTPRTDAVAILRVKVRNEAESAPALIIKVCLHIRIIDLLLGFFALCEREFSVFASFFDRAFRFLPRVKTPPLLGGEMLFPLRHTEPSDGVEVKTFECLLVSELHLNGNKLFLGPTFSAELLAGLHEGTGKTF